MESNNAPRVYDEDLDERFRDNDDEDMKKEGEDGKKEEEKKKPRKPLLKLDPTYLVDDPKGLKRLYKHMVVDAEKNLQLKGKGHETSDLNRVMKVLRGWHFESMPKMEVSYFADRLQRVGNDRATKAFLNKLRMVHLGLEVLDDFQPENTAPMQEANKNPAGFEYINTSSNNHNGSQHDDYANFLTSRPIMPQNARGPAQQQQEPYFRLMDLPQGQVTQPSQGLGFINTVVPPVRTFQDITPEQQRIIEENRLKNQEKKRKRQEAELNGTSVEHSSVAENPSKRLQSDEILKRAELERQLGFQVAYAGNDIDDAIDLNEDDLGEYLDDVDAVMDSQFSRKMGDDHQDGYYDYN